jgi:uncharacterized membrane protein
MGSDERQLMDIDDHQLTLTGRQVASRPFLIGPRVVAPDLPKFAGARQMVTPRPNEDAASPTVGPPQPDGLNSALTRNINALRRRRHVEEAKASPQEKLALAITAFSGSMIFVYLHLALVAVWITVNLGIVPGAPRFDRSFVILATAASVEAIFLSTFVLISQNRAAQAADRRADLDLQINLLAEHEITRLITLTSAIADALGVIGANTAEISELERDVAPEAVLDSLEAEPASGRAGAG